MRLALLTICLAIACVSVSRLPAAEIRFDRDIRPLLSDRCFHCHGPDEQKRKAELRLDTPEGAAKVLSAKAPLESELFRRITSTDPDERMPPADSNISKALTAAEVATLKGWLEKGAPYVKHWAFEAPVQATPPEVADTAWSANPVDRFIFARLTEDGLAVSPPADKATLIRRVTLDLVGLPPTPAEVDAFVNDSSPRAYEHLVDRLLASPHFGERLALAWMDLARYGDSSVYHADGPRDMWAWRDWVINAFNANMPFDRFTVEQLAGDLLPNATMEQKIASGFNRNHATTDEGGVIPEEFRVDYVIDRVKTVSNTWLAISLECGQCHDHKYDPITQREYYQFYAYFNNTTDAGMQTRNGNSGAQVAVEDPEADIKRKAAREAREQSSAKLSEHRKTTAKSKPFLDWLNQTVPASSETSPLTGLAHYFPLDENGKETVVSSVAGLVGSEANARLTPAARPEGDGVKFAGNAAPLFAEGPELEWNKPFTFTAWLNVPAKGGGGALCVRMDNQQAYRGFDVGVEGLHPGLHLVHHWPDNALKVYAKANMTPDAWHHVVISCDGSAKAAGVRIYVDGALQENQATADSLGATIATTTPFRLGSRSEGAKFKGEVDDLCLYDRALDAAEVKSAANNPLTALRALPVELRTPEQTDMLLGYYLRGSDKSYPALMRELVKQLEEEQKVAKGAITCMVMEDLPPKSMRATFVLNRGQYDQPVKEKEVQPGVPAVLPGLPAEAPANRLGLAQWLVQPDHPLTARVTVNRFWQLFFGDGLVRTSEDFGMQGEMPSHPELLDWLAVDFVRSGWDVKRMVKQLVSSAAYRQDSRTTTALRERDPENRLVAHGPRFRLQGEFIRDSALWVSGLIVEQIGGPSVKPYQPPNVWEDVALDTNLSRFVQDHGDKLYRRSMYTYWKRSAPQPSLMIFDAPTREKCTGRRPRTNTPLQALVTLNDPQFVEAARAFAQRIVKQGGASVEDRVRFAIRVALARPASDKELELLKRLFETQQERFQADPKKADELLHIGESPRDESIPAAEHAAWTVVANTVLNLDEFLVRN